MSSTPTTYAIRVEGHLDEHWSAWFGGATLTRVDDGTTTLRGTVADQAELHGLLVKVRDLGAPLLSVDTSTLPTGTAVGRGSATSTVMSARHCPHVHTDR